MPISTTSQTILASDLQSTVMTDIVQDEVTGAWVREFRFFGEPAAGQTSAPLLLTIRAESPVRDALKITTPTLTI